MQSLLPTTRLLSNLFGCSTPLPPSNLTAQHLPLCPSLSLPKHLPLIFPNFASHNFTISNNLPQPSLTAAYDNPQHPPLQCLSLRLETLASPPLCQEAVYIHSPFPNTPLPSSLIQLTQLTNQVKSQHQRTNSPSEDNEVNGIFWFSGILYFTLLSNSRKGRSHKPA
ncbi:hypothetical protein DL98DRAFT_171445 [Cadophora sp. DSE1049]|nr:hypothetical protein DL98DRAFT_171445 [Cadophora sp. DSE1049]